jgi:formate/nitrite transporter FocA (FNT family)
MSTLQGRRVIEQDYSHMSKKSKIETPLQLKSSEVYGIVASQGKEELQRPFSALAWSGLVAGIAISFSLFCEGFLQLHLPDNGTAYLIKNLGYSVGFLIVILGHFQLFTENTITVILPLLEEFCANTMKETARLWGIVLGANLVGTFLVALFTVTLPFFSADFMQVLIEISAHATHKAPLDTLFQAIPAGFLIAALVWMLPSSIGSEFWIIITVTFVIAIGDFAHVIAGSVEVFLLMLSGESDLTQGLGYLVMACIGNIIGGTGLFALMAYAQVREER